MPNGHVADEAVQNLAIENLRHQSHALVNAKLPAVAGDDAGTLLAAMLEGVKAIIGQLGGIRVAINAEHAAIVFWIRLHLLKLRTRDALIPPKHRGEAKLQRISMSEFNLSN